MFPEITNRILTLYRRWRIWRAAKFYQVDLVYITESVIQIAQEIQ